jgi:hypothetical protein
VQVRWDTNSKKTAKISGDIEPRWEGKARLGRGGRLIAPEKAHIIQVAAGRKGELRVGCKHVVTVRRQRCKGQIL